MKLAMVKRRRQEKSSTPTLKWGTCIQKMGGKEFVMKIWLSLSILCSVHANSFLFLWASCMIVYLVRTFYYEFDQFPFFGSNMCLWYALTYIWIDAEQVCIKVSVKYSSPYMVGWLYMNSHKFAKSCEKNKSCINLVKFKSIAV